MARTRPPPVFTGLIVHREPRYGCSMLLPEGWQRRGLVSEHGSGVVYLPDPADEATSFSFEGRELPVEVGPGDLKTLEQGMLAGIRQLPRARVQSREVEAVGRLVTMEARFTFREGDAFRKRWLRLLYHGATQVRLVAQGSSPAEFAYWEPMFFETMRTFRFAVWWGEVAGASWVEKAWPDQTGTPAPGS